MKLMLISSLTLLTLIASAETPKQQPARIERLENALLAPCCYTQPVSRHQSEIAVKMRLEIAKWVKQGKSDQEILDAYTKLYGAKVLVDPNTVPREWTYLVPWVALALGAAVAAWILRRWRATRPRNEAAEVVPHASLPDVPNRDFW